MTLVAVVASVVGPSRLVGPSTPALRESGPDAIHSRRKTYASRRSTALSI